VPDGAANHEQVSKGPPFPANANVAVLTFHSPPLLPTLQIKYSQLIHGLQQENIQVNRKMLSELAVNEPYSFKALVDQVRFMRGPQA
jgi:hypothetical protein